MAVARTVHDYFLTHKTSFFESQRQDFQKCMQILLETLKTSSIPFQPIPAEGGYFIMVDISACRHLVPEKYFKNAEFEEDPATIIEKNDLGEPVPLDLAFA